jgi:ribosomal protein S18 acetylase RimI-like enzyme
MTPSIPALTIRPARPEEYQTIGKMLVSAYVALPGMPARTDVSTPEVSNYYDRLANVGGRAALPGLTVFVAESEDGRLAASIDFIADMSQYGADGPVSKLTDAAAVRLLAVDDAFRGRNIGRTMTCFCIDRARGLGKTRLVLHTTKLMQAAWTIYERLGFVRYPEIDFQQAGIHVHGFQLGLAGDAAS